MVETVVAMTILLGILSLSFLILDRINRTVNPEARYKAHLATCKVLSREDLLLEETSVYEVEGYMVRKQLSMRAKGVYHLELTVLNGSGKNIYTRHIYKSSEIEL